MDVGGLLARFAPPPGDAGQVRAAADAWRRAAGELQGLAERGGTAVTGVGGEWRGPARQAFDRQWRAFSGGLGEGAAGLREGAQALDRAAEAIESAHARYVQVMAASAATVAVGLLLTPLTLGASDAAAGGAVAGEIALLLTALAETLGVEAATLAAVAGLAARMLTAFTVQTGVLVGTDVAAGALFRPDHDPFGHLDLAADVEGGLVGAVAAPLGLLAGLGGRVLPEALAAGRAGSALTDAAAFGASDALVRRAFDGSIDPGEVAFAVVGAGAGSLAGRALRRTGATAEPGVPGPTVPPAALAEELPAHLRAVLDASTPVPAGRSFFSPQDDPWFARLVPRVPAQPGRAVLFVHGNGVSVRAAGRSLSPEELARIVRADPALAGKPVTLFACETGRLDDGFAARLARDLGVEVLAPTELAWLAPDGTMYTTTGRLVDDGWLQTMPHNGQWRRFPPPALP